MSNLVVTHFNSGKVTPKIDARKDIEKYIGGCRELDNMIPDIYGNATRRPGTKLIVSGNGAGCYYEPADPDPAKIGITSMADLLLIGNDVDYPLDGDYEVLNNIDMSASASLNGGEGWAGIGSSAAPFVNNAFTGTFDGRNYTLSGMTIDTTGLTLALNDGDARGLFGGARGATIENVVLTEVSHTTNGICGGLIGYAGGNTVTNCSVEGTFTHVGVSNSGIGGGMYFKTESANPNTWTRCSVEISWIASGVGHVSSGHVGLNGFCDGVSTDVFVDCYAISDITHTGDATAGLTNIGGFFFTDNSTNVDCTNCYAAQDTGAITLLGTHNGGFVGFNVGGSPVYTDCFYNLDLSADDESDATGKTTGQMFTQSTYTNWDFDDVWQIEEDYPKHQWRKLSDIKEVCQRL